MELESQLARSSELVVGLRTAITQEAEQSTQLAREVEVEKDAADSLAGLRVRLKRLEAAKRVIGELLSEQSERVLTEQILHENSAQISSTFARLHAPNEFDLLVADGHLRIVRRSDQTDIELVEMSSGQRAAYALSLFLAMNERLQRGPKVLLFDDPVSHIDDINTLSFLDHLRHVALWVALPVPLLVLDSHPPFKFEVLQNQSKIGLKVRRTLDFDRDVDSDAQVFSDSHLGDQLGPEPVPEFRRNRACDPNSVLQRFPRFGRPGVTGPSPMAPDVRRGEEHRRQTCPRGSSTLKARSFSAGFPDQQPRCSSKRSAITP